MKIVIVGCGRVGASAAEAYDKSGHTVIILDTQTAAFDRLPSSFRGQAIRGDGTDEDVLRRAGADGADVFIALTEGDNRNIMAAQLANEALGIERVVAKINDPVRANAYSELGIATLCRTGLMMDRSTPTSACRRAACRASSPRPVITTTATTGTAQPPRRTPPPRQTAPPLPPPLPHP